MLVYASNKTIDSAKYVGSIYNISPIIMGTVVLALGTSLPEATNSITASILGHGTLVVGDIMGSALIQITFILGIIALIRPMIAKRKEILLIGGSAILASILAVTVAEKGSITQSDAILLIISWAILMYVNHQFSKKHFEVQSTTSGKKHIFILLIAMVMVILGASLTVTSAITISQNFGIPEFLIAFLLIGPGGSLPELAISLAALRKKEYSLSIGNLLGSNITDTTLALGIGPLISPIIFKGSLISSSGWYMIFSSIIVVGLFAYREKVDRKLGAMFIAIYFFFVLLILLGIL